MFAAFLFIASAFPTFTPETPVKGIALGYQLILADLNKDQRPDIIVVDERATDLAWYENPRGRGKEWVRHLLAQNLPRVINMDTADLDGDGTPEIALAHHFERDPKRSIGTLLLLKAGPDVREPWKTQLLDKVPTAHRVRFLSLKQGTLPVLLLAPLVGEQSKEPDYSDKAPVLLYRAPEWKRELINDELNGVLHSIAPVNWEKSGPQQILAASFDGISRISLGPDGQWRRAAIHQGDPRPCPECGSSEIKMGALGTRRFLAAIEPWHGNQLVVYTPTASAWQRTIVLDTMVNGHALAVGDLNRDGKDEIISGFRGNGYTVRIHHFDQGTWKELPVPEASVAAADCKIADLDGDGKTDFACSGAATGNVRIWWNDGAK